MESAEKHVNVSEIAYRIRRTSRAKGVRIAVRRDGAVLVTAPVRASERHIHAVVAEHAVWITRTLARVLERRATLHPDLAADSIAHYLRFKERARLLAHRKVKQWNAVLGFAVERIGIKRARTRWGSCSGKGQLNFHYKILFLPEELQDYLVIHELCHLAHMNHSEGFWKLVGSVCPEYRKRRNELTRVT